MAKVLRMDLSELAGLTAKLAEMGSRVGAELENALNDEGQVVATLAKELVPVDLGNLRSSIKVYPPIRAFHAGDEIFVSVVAGDTAVQYAEIQEENEEFRHKVGQAHYMKEATEKALIGVEDRLIERIASVK